MESELSTGKELDVGTASAQAGPAENQVLTVTMPFGNAAETGAVPCDSLLPDGISGGGNATAATHTIPLPYAECPGGPCCRAVPMPGRARVAAPQDLQHERRACPETAAGSSPSSRPSHTSRDTPGRCSSQVPARQKGPGKSRRYQHHHPAQHPSPAWSCPQRARAHRPWCQAQHCPAGSPLRRAAQAGWGAAYLLPRDVGSVGPGTGPQTPRVGLTPRFESVQEAAYQRSCCLCRFLSLLLPHPACRPHTYRPHRRSSAPPGRLQPQPRSPPQNPCLAPVGAAWPPPKSWGSSMGISGRAGGVCSVSSATGHGRCWCQPMGHGETGKTWPWGWGCWQWGWGGVVHAVQRCCSRYSRAHLPQREPG